MSAVREEKTAIGRTGIAPGGVVAVRTCEG